MVEFSEKGYQFENPGQRDFFLKECKRLRGKKGYISIIPWRKIKTNEQNRYYRGVVVQRLADYWGLSNEDAHQAISNEHLRFTSDLGFSLVKTTALNEWGTGEWEDYMSHLRQWAIEKHGVYIEEPNEIDFSTLPENYY